MAEMATITVQLELKDEVLTPGRVARDAGALIREVLEKTYKHEDPKQEKVKIASIVLI